MDASSVKFVGHFLEEGRRPDWFVTSPPYRNTLAFLKNACRIAKVGVTFKLRLNFLEPVNSRALWLTQNPPATVIVLTRATYRGRQSAGVEAWFRVESLARNALRVFHFFRADRIIRTLSRSVIQTRVIRHSFHFDVLNEGYNW